MDFKEVGLEVMNSMYLLRIGTIGEHPAAT
jgi:hypothetical protein